MTDDGGEAGAMPRVGSFPRVVFDLGPEDVGPAAPEDSSPRQTDASALFELASALGIQSMQTESDEPKSVAERARAVKSSLKKAISLAPSAPGRRAGDDNAAQITASALQDMLDQFTVWSGNLGAMHKPTSRMSLEQRLSEAPGVLTHITDCLDSLQEVLEDVLLLLSHAQPPTTQDIAALDDHGDGADGQKEMLSQEELEDLDPASLMMEVSDTIKALFRAAVLVRSASTRDRFAHALRSSTPCFPESFDINHVEHKFSKFKERREQAGWLIHRLGKANTKRRQVLKYYRDHKKRLAVDEDDEAEKQTNQEAETKRMEEEAAVAEETRTAKLSSKATTLAPARLTMLDDGPALVQDDVDETMSLATAMTTFDKGSSLSLPRLSDLSPRGDPFECPICLVMCSFRNDKAWRIHAYGDLRPYVCTLGDSSSCGDLVFPDRDSWFQHELAQHRAEFICIMCSGSGAPFDSAARFRAHLGGEHGPLDDEELGTLEAACRKVRLDFTAADCPLCNEWEAAVAVRSQSGSSAVTAPHLKRHVATHLEQLALFATPRAVETEKDSNSGGDSRTFDTVSAHNASHTSREIPPPPGPPTLPVPTGKNGETLLKLWGRRVLPPAPGQVIGWRCCHCDWAGQLITESKRCCNPDDCAHKWCTRCNFNHVNLREADLSAGPPISAEDSRVVPNPASNYGDGDSDAENPDFMAHFAQAAQAVRRKLHAAKRCIDTEVGLEDPHYFDQHTEEIEDLVAACEWQDRQMPGNKQLRLCIHRLRWYFAGIHLERRLRRNLLSWNSSADEVAHSIDEGERLRIGRNNRLMVALRGIRAAHEPGPAAHDEDGLQSGLEGELGIAATSPPSLPDSPKRKTPRRSSTSSSQRSDEDSEAPSELAEDHTDADAVSNSGPDSLDGAGQRRSSRPASMTGHARSPRYSIPPSLAQELAEFLERAKGFLGTQVDIQDRQRYLAYCDDLDKLLDQNKRLGTVALHTPASRHTRDQLLWCQSCELLKRRIHLRGRLGGDPREVRSAIWKEWAGEVTSAILEGERLGIDQNHPFMVWFRGMQAPEDPGLVEDDEGEPGIAAPSADDRIGSLTQERPQRSSASSSERGDVDSEGPSEPADDGAVTDKHAHLKDWHRDAKDVMSERRDNEFDEILKIMGRGRELKAGKSARRWVQRRLDQLAWHINGVLLHSRIARKEMEVSDDVGRKIEEGERLKIAPDNPLMVYFKGLRAEEESGAAYPGGGLGGRLEGDDGRPESPAGEQPREPSASRPGPGISDSEDEDWSAVDPQSARQAIGLEREVNKAIEKDPDGPGSPIRNHLLKLTVAQIRLFNSKHPETRRLWLPLKQLDWYRKADELRRGVSPSAAEISRAIEDGRRLKIGPQIPLMVYLAEIQAKQDHASTPGGGGRPQGELSKTEDVFPDSRPGAPKEDDDQRRRVSAPGSSAAGSGPDNPNVPVQELDGPGPLAHFHLRARAALQRPSDCTTKALEDLVLLGGDLKLDTQEFRQLQMLLLERRVMSMDPVARVGGAPEVERDTAQDEVGSRRAPADDASTPGQLSRLLNPELNAAFHALGGLAGIEKGLRANRERGLKSDETRLDGPVAFEDIVLKGQASKLGNQSEQAAQNAAPSQTSHHELVGPDDDTSDGGPAAETFEPGAGLNTRTENRPAPLPLSAESRETPGQSAEVDDVGRSKTSADRPPTGRDRHTPAPERGEVLSEVRLGGVGAKTRTQQELEDFYKSVEPGNLKRIAKSQEEELLAKTQNVPVRDVDAKLSAQEQLEDFFTSLESTSSKEVAKSKEQEPAAKTQDGLMRDTAASPLPEDAQLKLEPFLENGDYHVRATFMSRKNQSEGSEIVRTEKEAMDLIARATAGHTPLVFGRENLDTTEERLWGAHKEKADKDSDVPSSLTGSLGLAPADVPGHDEDARAERVASSRDETLLSRSGSTRSSASGDDSDFRPSATTRKTRSSAGEDDITIRVKRGAMTLKVGGAELQCEDGAEINLARSGDFIDPGATIRGVGGSDRTSYMDDSGSPRHEEREVGRVRSEHEAGQPKSAISTVEAMSSQSSSTDSVGSDEDSDLQGQHASATAKYRHDRSLIMESLGIKTREQTREKRGERKRERKQERKQDGTHREAELAREKELKNESYSGEGKLALTDLFSADAADSQTAKVEPVNTDKLSDLHRHQHTSAGLKRRSDRPLMEESLGVEKPSQQPGGRPQDAVDEYLSVSSEHEMSDEGDPRKETRDNHPITAEDSDSGEQTERHDAILSSPALREPGSRGGSPPLGTTKSHRDKEAARGDGRAVVAQAQAPASSSRSARDLTLRIERKTPYTMYYEPGPPSVHLLRLLDDLRSHPSAWAFRRTVDEADHLQDYEGTIPDLSAVQHKLESGQFPHPEDFLYEFRQMFELCRRYCVAGSPYIEATERLEEYMWQRIRAIPEFSYLAR